MIQRPLPVTVIVPVKNEEANLARCLTALERFSQVVVLDSGSTDDTFAIAKGFGAEILNFDWNGEFPKKRNWYLMNHKPANDWVLFLDADEIVNEEFCDEVLEKITKEVCDGYWLNYTNYFMGRSLKHGDPQRKLALFRFGAGLYEKIEEHSWSHLDMEVHEHPVINGKVGTIKSRIEHNDERGISKFIDRHGEYAAWEARRTLSLKTADESILARLTKRQRHKYNNIDKWWFAWVYFIYSYFYKRGFLDGSPGFALAFYKLWYFFTIRVFIKENESKSKRIEQ